MAEKVYYPANGKSCFVNGIRVDMRGHVPSLIEENGFEVAMKMNVLTLVKPQQQPVNQMSAPKKDEPVSTSVDSTSAGMKYKDKLAALKAAGKEYKGFPAADVVDKDYEELLKEAKED